MTNILNTNDTEADAQEPLVDLDEVDSAWDRSCSPEFESQDREKDILTQLRVEHLNMKESYRFKHARITRIYFICLVIS